MAGDSTNRFDGKEEENYWFGKFREEFHKRSFPEDFYNSAMEKKFENYDFVLPQKTAANALRLSNDSDKRLLMILSSVLSILVSVYSNHSDITIGTSIYKQKLQGDFINTILPLRTCVGKESSYKDYLIQVRNSLIEAEQNQNFAMSKLFLEIGKSVVNGYYPLFDVAILLDNIQDIEFFAPICINFLVVFSRNKDEVTGTIKFNGSCYSAPYIRQIAEHYIRILDIVTSNTDVLVGEVDFMSLQEKRNILHRFNDTSDADVDRVSICCLFKNMAAKNPGAVAVQQEGYTISYAELDSKSDCAAHLLKKHGAGSDKIIAVIMRRSIDFIIGLLGILKSGSAYLPIDMDYPEERIHYMLEESGAIFTLVAGDDLLSPKKGKIVRLEEAVETINVDDVICDPDLEDLAYLIYTSGSTGRPKGVMITHKAISNYLQWAGKSYGKDETISMPLYSSVSFDLTVTSIFLPLLTGGTIYVYNDKNNMIKTIFEDDKVDIIKLTPSHLALVKTYQLECKKIKKLIVGGEDLKTKLAKETFQQFKDIELYNEYGPTEATVGCMIHKYNPFIDRKVSVPIGVPAANTQIYILNDNLAPVPKCVTGELYIGGNGVARGYINHITATSEHFIRNPFIENGILYRTGDLARMNMDGLLEYIGRMDTQVKVRGFRIELSEIEHISMEFLGVDEAVAMIRGEEANPHIVVFLVGRDDINRKEYLEFLNTLLPNYMIPNKMIQINEMPKTNNGKVDKVALNDIHYDDENRVPYAAPSNDVEDKIAKIWGEILLIKKIGIDDEFFSLGGNSIKAMIVADRINASLNLQMQVVDIFDNPSIRKLTSRLLDIDSPNYRPVMKLNEERMNHLFVFPPMAGLGIAYKDLAGEITSHTVYAFDFIEDADRISQYMNLITDIQPSGTYQLLAYSSGGLLLYDVAMELERRGYLVEQVILMDCVSDKESFTTEERDNLINQELSSLKEAMLLKYPMRWKYVEESVERRIRAFMDYVAGFRNKGKLNACIHQIQSNSPEEDPYTSASKSAWEGMTCSVYTAYTGYGTHIEMLVKYLSKNVNIVNNILTSSINRDRRL